jgi:hypothetical protein
MTENSGDKCHVNPFFPCLKLIQIYLNGDHSKVFFIYFTVHFTFIVF